MPPPALTDPSAALTLGPASDRVRRTVGPIAWAVLECLGTSAVEETDVVVSHGSVRGIATSLGLAKDTVARALRRLDAEQLVTHVASRDGDGRFGTSHYRLDLPAELFLRPTTSVASKRRPTTPAQRPRQRPRGQLSLFEDHTPDVQAQKPTER